MAGKGQGETGMNVNAEKQRILRERELINSFLEGSGLQLYGWDSITDFSVLAEGHRGSIHFTRPLIEWIQQLRPDGPRLTEKKEGKEASG
jgi:hypothetical protein